MKISALGHSSFLLEMQAADGRTVTILGDPWLSDYVIGDLMGRYPRVRVDLDAMPPLDAIYISHSHTDHLDPYALTWLWQHARHLPRLLVPQSLEYLVPLFEEFLPGAQCDLLREHEPIDFHGLQVQGLFNLEAKGSNEDDVMMLLVESEDEVFLAEADAVFPYGDPQARAAVASLLSRESVQRACLLAIRNELPALMASVHAQSKEERAELVARARLDSIEEISEMYVPFDEDHADELWGHPRLLRLIGGQGICFPQEVDAAWNRVLFPLPLEERAALEAECAAEYGHACEVQPFVPGAAVRFVNGEGAMVEPCSFLECLDGPEAIEYDPESDRFEAFPDAPLRERPLDPTQFESRLLSVMNQRFLPWFMGRRQPAVEHLLSHYGGTYRVRVRYGGAADYQERDYAIGFACLSFNAAPVEGEAQEVYWATDLEDYLEGRCDDFSTFGRRVPGGDSRHLWDCLGMPYLNNDLVEKKLRFHFERARRGESVAAWVLPFWRTPSQ
ncbi:MAG: MBL fold metallo-hydrolase [Planctomycetota bacterium]